MFFPIGWTSHLRHLFRYPFGLPLPFTGTIRAFAAKIAGMSNQICVRP